MQVSPKQKAAGVAAAIALGFATIGATTVPAFAHGGGGGAFHGGGASTAVAAVFTVVEAS